MAMAEVYLPELSGEDHLTPFPRAPPPSPEMQPRSQSRVFEIPPSKFDGIGLDLRRTTFQFDEEDEAPLKDDIPSLSAAMMGGEREGGKHDSPLFPRDSDDDDEGDGSYPGSPQKRVCCSPLTHPRDFMTTVFPSSTNSFVSSGFGSFQTSPSFQGSILPENRNGTVSGGSFQNHYNSGSHSQSNSPPYLGTAGYGNQTSPYGLVLGGGGGRDGPVNQGLSPSQVTATTHLTTSTLYPPPNNENNMLSRSYDLHKMHPHLPLSFETTQLPEVRPSRSRTVCSSSPSAHGGDYPPRVRSNTLDATYNDDPNQRRRKISIKRKNPDDDSDADPSLQFSFEYSYSSTGSSGESDWLMVDCKAEPTRPMEKKACCSDDPSSVALSQGFTESTVLQGTRFRSGSEGLFTSHQHNAGNSRHSVPALSMGGSPSIAGGSIFFNSVSPQGSLAPSIYGGMASEPQQVTAPQGSEPVTMMDLDSLDSMDCDQVPSESVPMRGVAGDHLTAIGGIPVSVTPTSSAYQPPSLSIAMEQAPISGAEGLIVRPHPQEAGHTSRPHHSFPPLRHSCVEGYLQPSLGAGNQESGSEAMLKADIESKFNLSKSL